MLWLRAWRRAGKRHSRAACPLGPPYTLSFALWLPDERLGSADLQVMCQGF